MDRRDLNHRLARLPGLRDAAMAVATARIDTSEPDWAPLLLHQNCYTGASCKCFFRNAWGHRLKYEVLSQLSVLKLQGRCPTKGQKVHTLTGFSYFAGHCKSLANRG